MSTTTTIAVRLADAECIRRAVEAHRSDTERNIATYTECQKAALRDNQPEAAHAWARSIVDARHDMEVIESVLNYAEELHAEQVAAAPPSTHYDQLLHDLFVTAMEGGVNYWASLSGYRWSTGDQKTEDLAGFTAYLHDDEDDRRFVVNREVMDRGYRLAVGDWRRRINWQCDPDLPLPSMVTEDGWDHDASDADVIVQLGLLGDVVYG